MRNDLTNFQAQAAGVALHKLLYGANFYISDMDNLAKLLGSDIGGTDYCALHGMHCVKWADLPEPLRTQTREKIVELLGLPPVTIEAMDAEQKKEEKPRKLSLAFWKGKES